TAMPVADGRLWDDDRRPNAVITRGVAAALFDGDDPLGMRIYVGGRPFIVQGLSPSRAAEGADMRVIVPLRWTPVSDRDRDRVSQIVLRVNEGGERDSIIREGRALLRRRHRLEGAAENDFTIRDESALL